MCTMHGFDKILLLPLAMHRDLSFSYSLSFVGENVVGPQQESSVLRVLLRIDVVIRLCDLNFRTLLSLCARLRSFVGLH